MLCWRFTNFNPCEVIFKKKWTFWEDAWEHPLVMLYWCPMCPGPWCSLVFHSWCLLLDSLLWSRKTIFLGSVWMQFTLLMIWAFPSIYSCNKFSNFEMLQYPRKLQTEIWNCFKALRRPNVCVHIFFLRQPYYVAMAAFELAM